MTVKDILHPADQKAMEVMRRIPGFERVVTYFMTKCVEPQYKGENLGDTLSVTSENFPALHNALCTVCQKVGIPVPQLFVYNSPYINAYTYGVTEPFVALSSAAVNDLTPDELQCVIAHECGHILCKHTLYHTMLWELLWLGDGIGFITRSLFTPVILAMQYWSRKSELSADRCAAAVCGASAAQRTMLKLSCNLPYSDSLRNQLLEQAKAYRDFENSSLWHKIQQNCRVAYDSHPQTCLRAYEIDLWHKSGRYRQLRNSFV